MAIQVAPAGLRHRNVQIFKDEGAMDQYKGISENERISVKQIGDDIYLSIKIEVDFPSKHRDRELPILDLKVCVETREKETEGQVQKVSTILYYFYSKSGFSRAVINAISALP